MTKAVDDDVFVHFVHNGLCILWVLMITICSGNFSMLLLCVICTCRRRAEHLHADSHTSHASREAKRGDGQSGRRRRRLLH